MKIPTRSQDRGFAFNITPLIDVVFLLIIFFLVASHFIRNENLEQIDLPFASQGKEDEDSPRRLVITVLPGGDLMSGMTVTTSADFEQQLLRLIDQHGSAATELRIRADRSVSYSKVEPLLLTAARHGVTRVRFSVL